MKQEVNMTWQGGMAFESEVNGHKLVVDAAQESGGNDLGYRPKILMLTALGGCTGMDVISILKKMRIEPSYFNIRVEANMTEEHPKQYDEMKLVYEFKGDDLDESKLKKAIELSMDRYCGVSAVYKKVMPVSYDISILE